MVCKSFLHLSIHAHVVCSCVLVDNEQTLDDLLDIFNLNTLNIIAAWLQVCIRCSNYQNDLLTLPRSIGMSQLLLWLS